MALIDDLRMQLGMPGQQMTPQDMLAIQVPDYQLPQPQIGAGVGYQPPAMGAGIPAGGDEGPDPGGAGGIQIKSDEELKQYQDLARQLSEAMQSAQNPQGPRGMVPVQQTVQADQGGVPPEVRAQGVATRAAEDQANKRYAADAAEQRARELAEHAQRLRAEAEVEDEVRHRQEEETAAKQTRARDMQQQLAEQVDEPINPKRYFDNMSAFDKGASILSAAIYGFLNPRGGGAPPVVGILQQAAREDVAAQMANRDANQQRRNVLIQQYERQYGDQVLVQKRLEADRMLTYAKYVKAEGAEAKSSEVKQAAAQLQNEIENHVGTIHQEIQEAVYGQPVKTSTVYQRPVPTGAKAETPEQQLARLKAERDIKSLRETGKTTAERETVEKEEREQKRATDKEVRTEAGDMAKALQSTSDMQNAINDIARIGGINRDEKTSELQQGDVKGRGPWDSVNDRDTKQQLATAYDNAVDVLGRMRSGGAIGEDEEARFKRMLGEDSFTERGMINALKTMDAFVRRRAAEIKTLGSPEAIQEFERRYGINRGQRSGAPGVTVIGNRRVM